MMLWFFGYKLDWLPIGKFLYPEKWYDAPYDSDVIFVSMIKFTAVVSVLQILVYIFTRNIESLNLRRNARFAGFIVLTIASLFYWNSGDLAIQKPYAMDIAYHMILPIFTVTVVAFFGLMKMKTSGNITDDIPKDTDFYQGISFFEKLYRDEEIAFLKSYFAMRK